MEQQELEQEKLNRKKATALLTLKQANRQYLTDNSIKDTEYNNQFIKNTKVVEQRLDECVELYTKVCERAPKAGREVIVLPYLHDILTICNSFFQMINSEATRIGLLKRKLVIEDANVFSTPHEIVNLIEV